MLQFDNISSPETHGFFITLMEMQRGPLRIMFNESIALIICEDWDEYDEGIRSILRDLNLCHPDN